MMRILIMAVVMIALGRPALADLESGISAYNAGEYAAAFRELRPLAVAGDRSAAYVVSRMLLAGQGVERNAEEGLRWLRLAADAGVAEAQLQLAIRYERGLGLAQSDGDAAEWYQRAADQGLAGAQLFLGMLYRDGRGVPADLIAAHKWLNLATAALPPGQVRNSAAQLRDAVTQRLTPAQVTEAQRLAREWRPEPRTRP
jgi:TPR repeat protein